MILCYATNGLIGQVITGMINITGSLFLTLMLILMILIVVAIALSLPIEATSIIYLPLLIAFASCEADFKGLLGAILIYLGFLLASWLLPKN